MNAGLVKLKDQIIKKDKAIYIDNEVLEAIENIKATLLIEKRKGNPDADFILRRMR